LYLISNDYKYKESTFFEGGFFIFISISKIFPKRLKITFRDWHVPTVDYFRFQ